MPFFGVWYIFYNKQQQKTARMVTVITKEEEWKSVDLQSN